MTSPVQDQVLAHIDEHGSISYNEWCDMRPDVSKATNNRVLAKMHKAGVLRIKSWARGRSGPPSPRYVRADRYPDAKKPAPFTDSQKSKRYQARLRNEQGSFKRPAYKNTTLAYELFVLGKAVQS